MRNELIASLTVELEKMESYSKEIAKIINDFGWSPARDLERKLIHKSLFHLRKAIESLRSES